MSTIVDLDDAVEMIKKAVAVRGREFQWRTEFGGENCEYVVERNDEWVPGCIVGLGLSEHCGLTPEDLLNVGGSIGRAAGRIVVNRSADDFDSDAGAWFDWLSGELLDRNDIDELSSYFALELTDSAVKALTVAQSLQDANMRWGDVLDSVEEFAKVMRRVERETAVMG